MKLEDAIKLLQLTEIHGLEDTIKKLKSEKAALLASQKEEMDKLEAEKAELEAKYAEELKEAEQTTTNQDVLIKFIKNILYYDDAKATACMDTVQAQAEKLKILGEESKTYQKKNEMNLKHAYLQVDIIKSQEKEKELLKQTIKTQKALYEDYANMTEFDVAHNMENFPTYAQFLTKTLADQADKIKQMSEYFEEEKKVQENMEQILQEIKNLNFSISSDTAKWDLLEQYQNMISIQDANIRSLGPAITYVVQDNKRFQYETAEDGTLLGMVPCQCFPDTGDTGVSISGLQITCPDDTVSATTLEQVINLDCTDGVCPQEIADDTCGDYSELPWSEWDKCVGNCLVSDLRSRKVRQNGTVVFEFEGEGATPLILTGSENLDIFLPEGATLGVFIMGGGGGADDSVSGSSGFFKYQEWAIASSGLVTVNVKIGKGGDNQDGEPTEVDVPGVGAVKAEGGGYAGRNGWSGGSSEKGGWNGGSGDSKSNGSGEKLPTVCGEGVTITAGATGDYDSDGTGGGGVVVNGEKPYRRYYRDGEGYGAGGGEDDYDGNDGVAILMLCY